jgi:hypothetical protein
VDLFLLSSFPSVVLHLPGVFWYQLVCRCDLFRTFYTNLTHPTENSVLLSAIAEVLHRFGEAPLNACVHAMYAASTIKQKCEKVFYITFGRDTKTPYNSAAHKAQGHLTHLNLPHLSDWNSLSSFPNISCCVLCYPNAKQQTTGHSLTFQHPRAPSSSFTCT